MTGVFDFLVVSLLWVLRSHYIYYGDWSRVGLVISVFWSFIEAKNLTLSSNRLPVREYKLQRLMWNRPTIYRIYILKDIPKFRIFSNFYFIPSKETSLFIHSVQILCFTQCLTKSLEDESHWNVKRGESGSPTPWRMLLPFSSKLNVYQFIFLPLEWTLQSWEEHLIKFFLTDFPVKKLYIWVYWDDPKTSEIHLIIFIKIRPSFYLTSL